MLFHQELVQALEHIKDTFSTTLGIQVAGVHPGSLVLDVVVRYADILTPEQAFTIFKTILQTPARTTRVQNVLQVSKSPFQPPVLHFFLYKNTLYKK